MRIASDIVRRKDTCQLCSLFSYHIEKNHVEPNATIEIYPSRFCSTADKKDKDRETVRLTVMQLIETAETMIGPLEAYQIANIAGKENRCILELQECCSPVPTTADDDSQIQDHPSGGRDTRFSGRLISPKADLKLFAKWIKLCGVLHGESCGKPIVPMKGTQRLESFLAIDVERMCIIDAPAQCRYAALSYCWGKAPMFKHMLENSLALRKDGALLAANVPATIADAVELVRGVGERYLWVDALCIIQNDPMSQKAQLAQMGLIYSLAAFNIVAAAGSDANAGLPGVRANTRNIDQRLIRVGKKTLLGVVDGYDYYGGIRKSSWGTRAWTMQEKMLSKKLLIFTDQQVYWSCWNAVWLEEVVLENVFNISFMHDPVRTGPEDVGFSSIVESRDIYQLYDSLVNAYRERSLTFKSDILNAFSPLCQALSAIADESFHWGLPVSSFNEILCWFLRGGGARNYALCDPDGTNPSAPSVPFPSWSWAAWHGTSGHSWIHWRSSKLDSKEGTSGVTIFGYDTEGRLKQISENSSIPVGHKTKNAIILQREGSTNGPRPWQEQTQVVNEEFCKTPVNTGLLHFWTSTAILSIRRERNPRGTPVMLHSVIDFHEDAHQRLYMDAWAHPESINDLVASGKSVELGRKPPKGNEDYEVLEREFVVIHFDGGEELAALAVEWKDGVAYRIGILFVEERYWVLLQNRLWKRVILD